VNEANVRELEQMEYCCFCQGRAVQRFFTP